MARNRLGKRERERIRQGMAIDAAECAREALVREVGNVYAGKGRKRDVVKRIAAVHGGDVREELVTPRRPKVTDQASIDKRARQVERAAVERAGMIRAGLPVAPTLRGGTPLPPVE